ncbi:MAG: hypothetical protein ACK5XS_01575 [Armatimonadota bacterium]
MIVLSIGLTLHCAPHVEPTNTHLGRDFRLPDVHGQVIEKLIG